MAIALPTVDVREFTPTNVAIVRYSTTVTISVVVPIRFSGCVSASAAW